MTDPARERVVEKFLMAHGFAFHEARPLAHDASFRRYFRLRDGAVLMDAAPPEHVGPFLRIAAHLSAIGLSVPAIIAADDAAGLVIEEDLGDDLFSSILTDTNAETLFDAAIDALVVMHRAAPPPCLPLWNTSAMTEIVLGTLFDWWWPAMHGGPPSSDARAEVGDSLRRMLAPVETGPRGFVHRDFFAGNLLWLPHRIGPRRAGIIDFQSAAVGHPAYDLVSLLQDARRDIPASLEVHAIARYLAARPDLDPGAFRAAYVACAAQRHLRVACQWVRLARRDLRPRYLVHGPRTWLLLNRALADPVAASLARTLDRIVPLAQRRNPPGLTASGLTA